MLPEAQQISWWFLLAIIPEFIFMQIICEKDYNGFIKEKKVFPWWWRPNYYIYHLMNICFYILQAFACNIIQNKIPPWTWELNIYLVYVACDVLRVILFFGCEWYVPSFICSFAEVVLICIVCASFGEYSHNAFWMVLPCAIFCLLNFGSTLYAIHVSNFASSSKDNTHIKQEGPRIPNPSTTPLSNKDSDKKLKVLKYLCV